MECCQTEGIEEWMDEGMASKELRKYREKGPDHTTRALLDAIKAEGIKGNSLLDIGGGVGAIQHELLQAGASEVVSIDASNAYLAAARQHAQAQGHEDRISQVHGDFVDLADDLSKADIVTLDRVICCYDDMPSLVSRSVALADRLYGVVYPNNKWYVHLLTWVENVYHRIRGCQFRTFAHASAAVDRIIRSASFERVFSHETLLWHVHLYKREGLSRSS